MKVLKPRREDASRLPVNVSNPTKVFWPDEGYTKHDLAEYYREIFPLLQPYVKDRMLTLERCPDGMQGQCFYQKEKPKGMPEATPTLRIAHDTARGFTNYVVGGSLETELALVNLGCIAVHVMGSRASDPRKPDWVCIDLDPQSGEFADAARAGLHVKEALDALKLASFAKTSGSRGLHVFIPLRRGPDADEVLLFARTLLARVAAAHPDELTVEHAIAARGGRVYLDAFRNGFGQTVVSPYSVRRREKAPFSMPLAWSDVRPTLSPSSFNLGNYRQKLKAKNDPWKDFFSSRQSLTEAMRLLKKL
ncbi:MAG TPA: non-homologous end-joining DNA ligase [Candidatus Angelobacter sp.]|nr:non-homologous end-joining DNA ligase [Candidatus Angelobacter sp.]